MSTTNNQPATTNDDRIKLGKAGKLLSVEIYWDELLPDHGLLNGASKRWVLRNQTWGEVDALRGKIYTHGFMYPVGVDRWKVVHPMEIKSVEIWRQNDYFK